MEHQVEMEVVQKKECISCGEELKEQVQSYALECERCVNLGDEWLA